jgi:hypothetical protein
MNAPRLTARRQQKIAKTLGPMPSETLFECGVINGLGDRNGEMWVPRTIRRVMPCGHSCPPETSPEKHILPLARTNNITLRCSKMRLGVIVSRRRDR